jgi:hypothetical protein
MRLLTRHKVRLKANVTHRTGNESTEVKYWETVSQYTPKKSTAFGRGSNLNQERVDDGKQEL